MWTKVPRSLASWLISSINAVANDVIPAAFTFTDVTDASVSTQYTSDVVTVAGLTSGVSVTARVTGGTYSKNGGAFTSLAGTAQNGDAFRVRHTSSSSASTATNTSLTIGGVSDTFTTTTEAAPVSSTSGFAPVLFAMGMI